MVFLASRSKSVLAAWLANAAIESDGGQPAGCGKTDASAMMRPGWLKTFPVPFTTPLSALSEIRHPPSDGP